MRKMPPNVSSQTLCIMSIYTYPKPKSEKARASETTQSNNHLTIPTPHHTNPQSGLGIGAHPAALPVLIFASFNPTYASLLAGSPTVTDHVLSP